MTSRGWDCIEKAPPTKQTDLVTLPVVLHKELVSGTDVRIEVPRSVKWADLQIIQDGRHTMR